MKIREKKYFFFKVSISILLKKFIYIRIEEHTFLQHRKRDRVRERWAGQQAHRQSLG
jgi:hypothetical protein